MRLSSAKSAPRTAPAITIGEYARRTFWLVTASAACDSRRRRSIGGRSVAEVPAPAAASSNMERALIGSTVSKSVPAQASRHARAEAENPAHGLTDKSEETVIVGKGRLTISKRVAVAPQYSLDHRLLRKMHEDPLAKRFRPRQCGP